MVDPPPAAIPPILVNEVLAHTDLPAKDSIELFNPSTNAVNLGGWLLTDDYHVPAKYRIPDGVVLQTNQYAVITSDQFAQRMEKMSYEPVYMDPEQYSAFWSEYESGAKKWVEIGKK